MSKLKSNALVTYFFSGEQEIDLFQPATKDCSRSKLENIRLSGFMTLSILYIISFWLSSPSFFIQFMFFTMNGFFYTWLYFSLASIQTIIRKIPFLKQRVTIHKSIKYWAETAFQTAISVQVPITLMYWFMLFQYDLRIRTTTLLTLFASTHFFPLAFLLLDYKYNQFKFTTRRFFIPLTLGLLYLVFNYVYSKLHRPIYPILTWKDNVSYINASICFILALGAYWFFRYLVSSGKTMGKQSGSNGSKVE